MRITNESCGDEGERVVVQMREKDGYRCREEIFASFAFDDHGMFACCPALVGKGQISIREETFAIFVSSVGGIT